jgi:phosphatidylglycerol:prolipoprotein diacylglycerol transferase
LIDLLTISIGIDHEIGKLLGLTITWHGFFTAVGIVAGVWLAVRLATSPRVGIDVDTAYTIGLVVVIAGIVGARALYVIENYGDPGSGLQGPLDVLKITEGGISIYGAIIGGALAGWSYGLWNRLPSAAGSDAAAFGMLLGLAIGRIGDLINGEHFAKASSLPWAVVYTNPNSPGFERTVVAGPTHPATTYEMLGDLVIMGILALLWRRQVKSGAIFCLAFLLYAVMRFFVSFLRIDSEEPLLRLSTPQLVSVIVAPVAALLLLFFLLRKEPERRERVPAAPRSSLSRAERRRRLRTGAAGRGGPSR